MALEFIERSVDTLRGRIRSTRPSSRRLGRRHDRERSNRRVSQADLLPLRDSPRAAAIEVAAFDFSPGTGVLDQYVRVPPYSEQHGPAFLFLRPTR